MIEETTPSEDDKASFPVSFATVSTQSLLTSSIHDSHDAHISLDYKEKSVSLVPHFQLTRGCPALFPLQRNPMVWNWRYQWLMLLANGDHTEIVAGRPAEQKQLIHALQTATHKVLTAPESPFTDWERGSGTSNAIRTPAVLFHVGNITHGKKKTDFSGVSTSRICHLVIKQA
jgi:hypothetical protein